MDSGKLRELGRNHLVWLWDCLEEGRACSQWLLLLLLLRRCRCSRLLCFANKVGSRRLGWRLNLARL